MATDGSRMDQIIGRSPEWWDKAMIFSLVAAAIMAGIVAIATWGSVVSNKRAAREAEEKLEKYKLETASRVAEANTASIVAGERAARAQADADAAKLEIAKANEETARLSKEAAEARLETERLKRQVGWRDLSPEQAVSLREHLDRKGLEIGIYWSASDPEASFFARRIGEALANSKSKIVGFQPILSLGEERHGLEVSGSDKANLDYVASGLRTAGFDAVTTRVGGTGPAKRCDIFVGYRPTPPLVIRK